MSSSASRADALRGIGIVVAIGLQHRAQPLHGQRAQALQAARVRQRRERVQCDRTLGGVGRVVADALDIRNDAQGRSEEHTSELQSLMRISYAVFCLKKKK